MATANNLFSLQGKFFTVQRDKNNAVDLKTKTWLGNVEEATLEIAVEKEDKKESFSGQRGIYGTIITEKTVTLNMTLDEWLPEVLALGLFSKQVDVPSKTVTSEAFPSGLTKDDVVSLDGLFVSEVILTDSDSKVLVEGEDYIVSSTTAGEIKLLKAIAAQPVTASYKTADTTSLAFLSEVQAPERFLIFEGIDTQNNKSVYLELYRVQFEPTSSFGLINESFGTLPLVGTLLIDSERLDNSLLGGYARIVTKE